jgi:hypothetical protein
MKNIITTIISLATLAILITTTVAVAGERLKVFELAESGQTIEFPMTAGEIAAKDAEESRLNAIRADNAKKPRGKMIIFEMGEGGQIVTFPMTAEEIAAEEAESARLAAILKADAKK